MRGVAGSWCTTSRAHEEALFAVKVRSSRRSANPTTDLCFVAGVEPMIPHLTLTRPPVER
jgi:hypothetical protein